MAFFSHALSPAEHVAARTPAKPRPGLFTRFAAAFVATRQRDADRAIASYLQHIGGKLTDSVEREIERRFFGAPKI